MTKLPISTRSAANNPLRPTHVCHHLHKLGKKLKSKDLGSVVPDYDDAVGGGCSDGFQFPLVGIGRFRPLF